MNYAFLCNFMLGTILFFHPANAAERHATPVEQSVTNFLTTSNSSPNKINKISQANSAGQDLTDGTLALQKGNYRLAFPLLSRACELDVAAGCAALAQWYEYRPHKADHLVQAFALYQKSCHVGNQAACVAVAGRLVSGRGTPANRLQGLKLYKNLCYDGQPYACLNLGINATIADLKIINVSSKLEIFEKGCDLKLSVNCYHAAEEYIEKKDYYNNLNRVINYYRLSCDDNLFEGCYKLGLIYLNGSVVGKNSRTAISLLEYACAGDNSNACLKLADLSYKGNGVPLDKPKAAELYEQACNTAILACLNAGRQYQTGDGVAKNDRRAARFFDSVLFREEGLRIATPDDEAALKIVATARRYLQMVLTQNPALRAEREPKPSPPAITTTQPPPSHSRQKMRWP